ncbi:hypothetical protein CAPTEDRAFT_169629 [Capitella teleta]|uniref:MYND-type domain-containing protein n=1 Tax=Capitella teleta TaxID=283909 RepID=R7V304_CAPTE|nr:hypothetical protein CAPTEDRAFT_169629 [Capitella teleta]|eukprot:ELU10691.1 hypothetical protein CAPTEDRAFT_169629 [Capitella teleta]
MVQPVRKRQADPLRVPQFWQAIVYVRQQKQIPNLERVQRYMNRTYGMKFSECELELQYCVKDGLLNEYTALGFKGQRTGIEQEGYRLPSIEDEFDRGKHDWYCFDCHQPGEVVECDECWRVYHPTCTEDDWTAEKFICAVCKATKRKPRIKRKELNRLVTYTLNRIKHNLKTKELHKFGTTEEDQLKVDRLVHRYMDLNLMEGKAHERKYKYLEQFYSDCRTILHNTFICFGDTGLMAELAKIMMRDCKYDLDEIRQCKDCYQFSNAKPKDWFAQPCRPAHKLVFAKQKGFCYWPAKVIKITTEGYDVRFFGGWHQRAYIPENNVKTIESNVKQLNIKRTAGFVKAMKELSLHQELMSRVSQDDPLEQPSDNEQEEEEDIEPPEIRHKKFRKLSKSHRKGAFHFAQQELMMDAMDVSSSQQDPLVAETPEDANMVTSSEDNILSSPRTFSTSDIGVQTSKKLSGGKQPHKNTQTEVEYPTASTSSSNAKCHCETKYNKAFMDYKTQLEKDAKADKDRALKELEERLRADFELDKQAAVSRAMGSTQRDTDKVRRQMEERCKEQFGEDLKKVIQKHKSEVSSTKKKQWCYNCEEEAMYHCCWNTSYCSIKCQQDHWHREHKRMCRRKRNIEK